MKKKIILLILLVIPLFLPQTVFAQSQVLKLRITRDFGYGAGNQLQGTLSFRAEGP